MLQFLLYFPLWSHFWFLFYLTSYKKLLNRENWIFTKQRISFFAHLSTSPIHQTHLTVIECTHRTIRSYVANSPFARRQRQIKCHLHGGIPFVVIRACWWEPTSMAVKCIVKCAPIPICALSPMWAPVRPVTIWLSRVCRCKSSKRKQSILN